ncbi:MAG: hypothetical protein A2512_10865 [Deltaproteobacteria bacterium RIFOXYD12_FULL_56_24]|nr:MAG: hypothetical protein A2512_10865 [Deltaproteobacteria bacterium RIFOXYD12_FULL_56_24]
MLVKIIVPLLMIAILGIGREFFWTSGPAWLFYFLLAASITMALLPLIIKLAFHFKILDQSDHDHQRKVHRDPTPKIGGIAVVCGFLPALLLAGTQSPELAAIIVGSFLIFLVGVLDDIFCLSTKLRFLAQLTAALLVIWFGVRLSLLPETNFWARNLNVFLTLLWIIGITNAFNFLDGINGEASGLAVIIGTVLAIFAFAHSTTLRGEVIVIAVGATAGFMPYNLKRRAEIFLGDGGSGFLGFFLAVMALYINWGDQPGLVNLFMPVAIFSLGIYDMCMTTVTRIHSGKVRNFTDWLVYTGKDHLHHRLTGVLGGSRLAAVFFIYAVAVANAVFPVLYIVYRGTSDWFIYAAFAQTLLIYAMITIMLFSYRYERRKTPRVVLS